MQIGIGIILTTFFSLLLLYICAPKQIEEMPAFIDANPAKRERPGGKVLWAYNDKYVIITCEMCPYVITLSIFNRTSADITIDLSQTTFIDQLKRRVGVKSACKLPAPVVIKKKTIATFDLLPLTQMFSGRYWGPSDSKEQLQDNVYLNMPIMFKRDCVDYRIEFPSTSFYCGKTDIREVYERTEGAFGKTARQRRGICIDLMDIANYFKDSKFELPSIFQYLVYEYEMNVPRLPYWLFEIDFSKEWKS